jgi:LmbE family N-acetylglucosaminyl deacetylase
MQRWQWAATVVGLFGLAVATGRAEAPGSYAGSGSGLDLMDVDILFVGAHPDDDSGVLATLGRYVLDEGYKASVLTLTGGEGGGNAIGRESGAALGLIRQEEERRSLALVGVPWPHFLGLRDFYFTLSAEETRARWGEDFLCEVVRRVRLQRPEVIVTMWPGPGTHGQHQMAARAATLAYARGADPTYCPDQITREFLSPFAASKLYYFAGDRKGPGVVSIATSDFSRSADMRYADLRALAVSKYRSQGYDQFSRIPVAEAAPESFLLVASRVPVLDPEAHLLEGAIRSAGASPAGVGLEVESRAQFAVGVASPVTVRLRNGTSRMMSQVVLSLRVPDGWTAVREGSEPAMGVEPKGTIEAHFRVQPSDTAVVDTLVRVDGVYQAEQEGRAVGGSNRAFVKAQAPLTTEFLPLFDIAAYRDFARETRTEWVIPSLPTRLPLVVGRSGPVAVVLRNQGSETARGELTIDPVPGVRLPQAVSFVVPARGSTEARLALEVDSSVLPEGRHSARLPVTVRSKSGSATSHDTADVYALPSLTIPRVVRPPVIDGDLADMRDFAKGSIGPKDLWWRREPKDAADLSADFFLAYDARFLYVGLHVRDDVVVCNIAPDDIKAQLRSDAVGITVDPSGRSRDTSTTFQAAAFPCTTEGFKARGFRDADARPGLMEQTAPGMQVASLRTLDGFDLEAALPWAAMPKEPRPGDEIGLNLVLYDGDQKDAAVGANISKSGLAWAAFEIGGKQALPYLWPRVVLAR